MKFKIITLGLIATLLMSCSKEDIYFPPEQAHTTVMAMGASLMASGNSWFTDGCNQLECGSYNKAVSGTMPEYFAEKLWRGSFCSDVEFENTDILAIQFANTGDVYNANNLIAMTADYYDDFDLSKPDNPFTQYTYAQNLDFILKFWKDKCEQQEFNENSKWFGIAGGKPFKVILITHWHDARVTYNESIRLVAEKWNLPVCEFDKNIGFTKDKPLADGTQVSILYAQDTEVIDNVKYGWHPKQGKSGKEIQSRMANIFVDALVKSGYLNEYENELYYNNLSANQSTAGQ